MTRPPLDAPRWTRVAEFFAELTEADAGTRLSRLEAIGREDPVLREEVESLLAAHVNPGLLGSLDDRVEIPPPGRIGPFRLLEILGTGGMGVVYLAEREGGDFTQRVALKLVRAGFADPRLEERLRRERRILATLEHPGIARFIDGGTTATGQSYFAMEFIEGTSLIDFCTSGALPIADRLRLFIEVCEALNYAHQQLVVHGDLKPGNILVTREGRPKLLDFGIAELLDPSTGEGLHPRTQPWMTPAYASPEQICGDRITAPTDVYALGVMLFELLTGQLPYEVDGLTPAQMGRVICDQPPSRPSSMAADKTIRHRLEGDLDTIILKALAKEPNRRYDSAARLAADLRRYLDGRPVLAQPDSLGYRMGKFVRRHRLSVAAGVLLFLSLVGGLAAVSWQAAVAGRQRDRAEESRRQSEELSAFLISLFQAADPSQSGSDTLAARALLRRGIARVEELGSEPAIQARMLDALGQIQLRLGRYRDAEQMIDRAYQLRRRVFGEHHPETAQSYRSLALVARTDSRAREADSLYRLALAIQREVLGEEAPAVAETLLDLAYTDVALARLDSAQIHSEQAVQIRKASLGPNDPLVADAQLILARTQWRNLDYMGAEANTKAAIALRTSVSGPRHPQTAAAIVQLGDLYQEFLGRPVEAESLYRAALAIEEAAMGPDNMFLVHVLGSLATQRSEQGDHVEAERLWRRYFRITRTVLGDHHPSVAVAMENLASELLAQGRLDEAAAMATDALVLHRRLRGAGHVATAGPLSTLANIRRAQGRYDEATALGEEALELRLRALGDRHGLVAIMYQFLGQVSLEAGRPREADSLFAQAIEVYRASVPDNHPRILELESLRVVAGKRLGGEVGKRGTD
ncbi:MAG TPA: serine/threonine-protein kinase [Gemmatimonadales bacterium]|nr:serine/threonine-protein kinase [Gemmatimonadales bacterium]